MVTLKGSGSSHCKKTGLGASVLRGSMLPKSLQPGFPSLCSSSTYMAPVDKPFAPVILVEQESLHALNWFRYVPRRYWLLTICPLPPRHMWRQGAYRYIHLSRGSLWRKLLHRNLVLISCLLLQMRRRQGAYHRMHSEGKPTYYFFRSVHPLKTDSAFFDHFRCSFKKYRKWTIYFLKYFSIKYCA